MDTNENILAEDKIENQKNETESKNKKDNEKKPKKWKYMVGALLIVLSVMLVYVYFWTVGKFGNIPFAQVIFHLVVPMEGADSSFVIDYITGTLSILLCVAVVAYIPFIPDTKVFKSIFSKVGKNKNKKNEDTEEKKKRPKYGEKKKSMPARIWGFIKRMLGAVRRFYVRHFLPITSVVLVGVIIFDVFAFGIDEWLADRLDSNTIFEDYYVDSADANIQFPADGEKKNLIFILSESLEASFADEESGGMMDRNYIPNLTRLAEENTHFSSRDNIQGATEVEGVSWTIAAMVSYTSGVPLMIPIGDNSYGRYEEFLPGVTSMGELLKKNGYTNEIILGSKSEFAGIDTYFKSHGDYKIFDYYTAIERELISEDYYEFWGYEDVKLFDYAKTEIEELSQSEQPFSIIINTIDMHTPLGYKCSECGSTYTEKYLNVIACQDRQINEFVEWVKTQDFYEDTVIVIAGDHLSMAPKVEQQYWPEDGTDWNDDPTYLLDGRYERTTYHVIINSDVEATNTTNRIFSTMDMYPTIMTAIGCKIEGDRLGIGTNLYSGTPTVMEIMGKEKFMDEISKNSILYNDEILGVE